VPNFNPIPDFIDEFGENKLGRLSTRQAKAAVEAPNFEAFVILQTMSPRMHALEWSPIEIIGLKLGCLQSGASDIVSWGKSLTEDKKV
jgi:hypothetical protein